MLLWGWPAAGEGPTSLLQEVLEAHGGLARWSQLRAVRARLAFGGLAFALRWNRAGARERVATILPHRAQVVFEDFPGPGYHATFTPERVWIADAHGGIRSERASPRDAFASWRRALWWDDLDLLYFSGYATWNYFTHPFLLAAPGVECAEREPCTEGGQRWRRLEARFSSGFPTHSPVQMFYYDESLRLRRHDYTATVFASWAAAAHYSYDHVTVQGIPFPARRRVVPRGRSGAARRGPTLVWIRATGITLDTA